MQEKNELIEKFSARFSEAIRQSGKKQKEIAFAVTITEQTLSKYKRGERIPDTEELYRLSRFFGVSMNWLLGDNDPIVSSPHPFSPLETDRLRNKLNMATIALEAIIKELKTS